MGFTTQAIRYGWVALASLGVLTGTTIYTLTPTRKQVKPQDIIEIDLAIWERCLATQTGTNADGTPIYAVAPDNYIETWTDTNGASVTVTNTIGWHMSRAYRIAADAKIKALVPYYCDINTIYDGTTNIAMLTVTGLWASLGIGDGTNKFTRTPEIETNAATYGDYPWQIYVEDLQERAKVLNALKCISATVAVSNEYAYGEGTTNGGGLDFEYGFDYTTMVATAVDNWNVAKTMADAMAATNTLFSTENNADDRTGGWITLYTYTRWFYKTSAKACKTIWKKLYLTYLNSTELSGNIHYYVKTTEAYSFEEHAYTNFYDKNGIPNIAPLLYYKLASFTINSNAATSSSASICSDATWCETPNINAGAWAMRGFSVYRSYPYPYSGHFAVFIPTFAYCTNKFW